MDNHDSNIFILMGKCFVSDTRALTSDGFLEAVYLFARREHEKEVLAVREAAKKCSVHICEE